MTKEYNCPHPPRHTGNARAGCLAEAYELLDRAFRIIKIDQPTHNWVAAADLFLLRKSKARINP